MINKSHYEGYSFALLEIAKAENKIQQFKAQAELIRQAFEDNPEYIKILSSYDIPFETKEKLLREAFKRQIDVLIYRLLFVLIKKRKIGNILDILNLYIDNINKMNAIQKGTIYSSKELTEIEIQSIEQKITKQLGYKVILTNVIDKKIIAGFKVIINDVIIDATIMNQLKSMKEQIIGNNN